MPDDDFALTPPAPDAVAGNRHGAERTEWERRFLDHFRTKLGIADEAEAARVGIAAELESWPADEDDWKTTTPESAADDNLSCWTE